MSLLVNLFKLIPPSFKANYCPKNIQQLANDLIGGTQLTFLIQQGNFIYNFGSATPTPENRIFPWLYSPNGRWYTFQFGLWTSPMNQSEREPDFRKMWKPPIGTPPSAIWSVDGGDGTDPSTSTPTAITGAAWDIDHDFDGVFPIGVGAVPGSNPAVTIALGDVGGNAQHTLTEAEGATGIHTHAFGKYLNGAVGLAFTGNVTVPNYTGAVVQGVAGSVTGPDTTVNTFTLPSGTGATGVPTPTPFSILPPYRGIWWVKPTVKIWYTLPP